MGLRRDEWRDNELIVGINYQDGWRQCARRQFDGTDFQPFMDRVLERQDVEGAIREFTIRRRARDWGLLIIVVVTIAFAIYYVSR
jgi:hypothetical protein